MTELKNEAIAAVAQALVSEKNPLGLQKMPSEDEGIEITFGYPVSDDDEKSVAEVPRTETPTNGGSQLTEDDYEAFARFREDLSRQKHPQVLSYIKEELESHMMEVTDLHVQETAELHARVTANEQEISGLIAFIAELKNRLLESDQKIADLTALLMAVTERPMAVEKILKNSNPSSGTGEPDSWVEAESPVHENEKSFDAPVDTSVDVASFQKQLAESGSAEVKQFSIVKMKPSRSQKQKTFKSPKDFMKNSRIYWEEFTVEFGGQKKTLKTFWKIKRGFWKNLASFAPHWDWLSEEMHSHLLELWRIAEDLGYLASGRQVSITKGKALFNNPDSRGDDELTIDSITGVWKGFPFVVNESKPSMKGQGLVGINCFCPICFDQGILLPWPYSPYTWDEMVAKWAEQSEGGC